MRKVKIRIKNLSKNFGDKVVLKNLNLDVYESESLAIIGESGTGKSVLTKCIDGLEDYDSGIISYENIIIKQSISKEFQCSRKQI